MLSFNGEPLEMAIVNKDKTARRPRFQLTVKSLRTRNSRCLKSQKICERDVLQAVIDKHSSAPSVGHRCEWNDNDGLLATWIRQQVAAGRGRAADATETTAPALPLGALSPGVRQATQARVPSLLPAPVFPLTDPVMPAFLPLATFRSRIGCPQRSQARWTRSNDRSSKADAEAPHTEPPPLVRTVPA